MITTRKAKPTLTPVELCCGDSLEFERRNGNVFRMELLRTRAEIIRTTLTELKIEENNARTEYRFACDLKINGNPITLEREVGTQRSFYEPWEIDGVRIWFDAVDDIFSFLSEGHGPCRPQKDARFAVQEAGQRICPDRLHPWLPMPEGGLRIENCYRGEDCWMGAYNGASAHGGLDINHPRGTPLWTPVSIDDHYYFNSVKRGHNNNRWRGIHRWPDGSEWILQAHHMTELTVPEHTPIPQGGQFAWGAGVLSGAVDHSHFVFKIAEHGDVIMLDPWILFWQMYQDEASQAGSVGAATTQGE